MTSSTMVVATLLLWPLLANGASIGDYLSHRMAKSQSPDQATTTAAEPPYHQDTKAATTDGQKQHTGEEFLSTQPFLGTPIPIREKAIDVDGLVDEVKNVTQDFWAHVQAPPLESYLPPGVKFDIPMPNVSMNNIYSYVALPLAYLHDLITKTVQMPTRIHTLLNPHLTSRHQLSPESLGLEQHELYGYLKPHLGQVGYPGSPGGQGLTHRSDYMTPMDFYGTHQYPYYLPFEEYIHVKPPSKK